MAEPDNCTFSPDKTPLLLVLEALPAEPSEFTAANAPSCAEDGP